MFYTTVFTSREPSLYPKNTEDDDGNRCVETEEASITRVSERSYDDDVDRKLFRSCD